VVRRTRGDLDLHHLELFDDFELQCFHLAAEHPAALLVHGFPGTPAEMRLLARTLHVKGWTARGALLPGFGPDIGTLLRRRRQEWSEHLTRELRARRAEHSPTMVIGYSMGGAALALSITTVVRPDALVLIAPFWRIGNKVRTIIWKSVKRFFPTLSPLLAVRLDDPGVRKAVGGTLPDQDVSSPGVQESLRRLRVPTSLIDQVLFVGRGGGEAATHITIPTLIIQGAQDRAVLPKTTRKLLQRIPGPVRCEEVQGGHNLNQESSPAWPQLSALVASFAGEIACGS
jgi:carboxylesterase